MGKVITLPAESLLVAPKSELELLALSQESNPFLGKYSGIAPQEQRSLIGEFINSGGYAALQHPYEGLRQFVNDWTGCNTLGEICIFDAPQSIKFSQDPLRSSIQFAGNALGIGAPVLAVGLGLKGATRAVGGLLSCSEGLSAVGIKLSNQPLLKFGMPIVNTAAVGGIYEGVLRPVEDGQGERAAVRWSNAGYGALSFGSWAATSSALRSLDVYRYGASQPWIIDGFAANVRREVLSGGFSGFLDIEARRGGSATLSEILTSSGSFMLMAGTTRGLHEGGLVLSRKLSSGVRSARVDNISSLDEARRRRDIDSVMLDNTIEQQRGQLLDFKRPERKLSRKGVESMILEEEIAKFDSAKQEAIRLDMERLMKKGYPKEWLDLWPDGTVTYNSRGHLSSLEMGEPD